MTDHLDEAEQAYEDGYTAGRRAGFKELTAVRAEIARLQKALLKCAAIPHMGQYTAARVRAAIEESKPWSTPARETDND